MKGVTQFCLKHQLDLSLLLMGDGLLVASNPQISLRCVGDVVETEVGGLDFRCLLKIRLILQH